MDEGDMLGVAQLKARLSEVLQRVADGHEVTVTAHGKPVARLVPAGDQMTKWKELVDAGVITPARQPRRSLPQPLDIGPHESLFDRSAI